MMKQKKSVKVGRNDACPCGSGKKYKNCCMGRSAPPPESLKQIYQKRYNIRLKSAADVEKIRRLPWLVAADTLNTGFFLLTFSGSVFILFLNELGLKTGQIGFDVNHQFKLVGLFKNIVSEFQGKQRQLLIDLSQLGFFLLIQIGAVSGKSLVGFLQQPLLFRGQIQLVFPIVNSLYSFEKILV